MHINKIRIRYGDPYWISRRFRRTEWPTFSFRKEDYYKHFRQVYIHNELGDGIYNISYRMTLMKEIRKFRYVNWRNRERKYASRKSI